MARDYPFCPNCDMGTDFNFPDNRWHCGECGWTGDVYLCHAGEPDIGPAETARPEDAVCANHPGKRAVAVCAGSGDYICSLCRVRVGKKDFSVQHLDRQRSEMDRTLFSTRLPRWGRIMDMCFVLCLVFLFAPPLFALAGTWILYKSSRERSSNPLYGDFASHYRVQVFWLVMAILTYGYCTGLVPGYFSAAR